MTAHPWRPTCRRLADTLFAALAPATACCLALGGLIAWTASGTAGGPARIAITEGRVLPAYADGWDTAAFFRITNTGGTDDRLLKVTSPAAAGAPTLNRHRMTGGAAAYGQKVASAAVPVGDGITMSPHGLDVRLRAKTKWRAGDLVPFTLHFEHGGRIDTRAKVARADIR
ncbi:copper chaperone PCu(A)C [Streptomyces botrytidirepellens]|uniref:Copper chaperone PCu(A)C n=1 Tax=Streptomyces botrytidirepellens TaxID=2486417 RepID=A0A3M8X0E4_9ACTN|nr:copper chaperone PCu(A)C [Streptomyces botrytidirepellens]RNG34690.1 copper chaperone PCu(A)C [Streptomyces botrytidirepellens]